LIYFIKIHGVIIRPVVTAKVLSLETLLVPQRYKTEPLTPLNFPYLLKFQFFESNVPNLLPAVPDAYTLLPAALDAHIMLPAAPDAHTIMPATPDAHTIMPAAHDAHTLLPAAPDDNTLLPAAPDDQTLLPAAFDQNVILTISSGATETES
jgi:hypothetical protein